MGHGALNSTSKNITGKVAPLAMRGQRQGRGWFGESVDGVARFLVFAANTERRSFIYRPESRNESLSGPTASARAVTIYAVGANNG